MIISFALSKILLRNMPKHLKTIASSEESVDSEKEKTSCIKTQRENTCADVVHTTKRYYDLTKFQQKSILCNNNVRKSITLLGTFPDISTTDNAIIIFEKQSFRESDVSTNGTSALQEEKSIELNEHMKKSFFNSDLQVQQEFVNNIYGSYQCIPSAELNAIKATVVYPATEKHIEKYSIRQKYVINETPALYEKKTLPYIQTNQFTLDWVYNILEHKQETERIVFEDNDPEIGFILLPDIKWNGRDTENLYLLAIIHKRNIKSLRDLNATHLPLLRNLRIRAIEAITERYGLIRSQLRLYFHYLPSFYHLHVHINPVRNEAPGIACEKSHMLDMVINNLELMTDYYQRATLLFVLYEGNKLFDLYEEQIIVHKKRSLSNDTDYLLEKSDEIAKRVKFIHENTKITVP